METEIISVRENPLLDRFEVEVTLDHDGEPTPSEQHLISRIAAENNLDEENIEVDGIYTGFGSQTSRAEIKVREEFEYGEHLEESIEEQDEVGGTEKEYSEETAETGAEEIEDKETGDPDYEDIVSGTISDGKEQLQEIENPDYKAALEAEQDNKNRTTFTDWLENQAE